MAPPLTGAKRQAGDRADGEPRQKRKRVDATPNSTSGGGAMKRHDRGTEGDARPSQNIQVDFSSMPTEALHKYLAHYDLIPRIYPSPLSPEDPPPPSSLLNPHRHSSRMASPPPQTNRREPQNRRRSSRLLEDETRHRTPVLADREEIHDVLAALAERHFREHVITAGEAEVTTLSLFMTSAKSKADFFL
ncbi:hypothetical protein GLOTRDRAFT_124864 [Gloeophyllum trabeum ATCC 11539]|uniref:Histone deacetylase complex subunit SAP30 Sin3 binding domain-containing protein n=1 Tax=Gloeophyllum trabeum (strain ATCC 11539 / FP-39264 / Madison 617) TaxID=670483 RepID=S7QNN6_GLOTA|nr:uncharacterized protein GLOTRDRAFT_124864 [Gloeophyllum trabeum ATCC 11539]EPQ61138.1 hypothetical protein GLOTRDRAFT_124864 [Gloeophyllum trabeum ATCC 11539]